MNKLELLKKQKNLYENILEVLKSGYINNNLSNSLEHSLDELKEVYNMTYSDISEKELKTEACCKNCNNNLLISDNVEYSYQCTECDENFYDFEVDEKIVWYKKNDEGDRKLKSSFYLDISFDKEENDVCIGTDSSSGANYECSSIDELIKSIKDYCYSYLEYEEYSIEYWETDWHRDAGEGMYYDKTFSSYDAAIKKARELFIDNNYASIEVLDSNNEAVYCRDDESEEFYFDDDKISCVDSDVVNKYIDNWTNKKEQTFSGDKLYCSDNNLYIGVDNSTGNCWVEEFNTEKEVQKWLLGKDLNKGGIENEI